VSLAIALPGYLNEAACLFNAENVYEQRGAFFQGRFMDGQSLSDGTLFVFGKSFFTSPFQVTSLPPPQCLSARHLSLLVQSMLNIHISSDL